MLMSDKVDFKAISITNDKKGLFHENKMVIQSINQDKEDLKNMSNRLI